CALAEKATCSTISLPDVSPKPKWWLSCNKKNRWKFSKPSSSSSKESIAWYKNSNKGGFSSSSFTVRVTISDKNNTILLFRISKGIETNGWAHLYSEMRVRPPCLEV